MKNTVGLSDSRKYVKLRNYGKQKCSMICKDVDKYINKISQMLNRINKLRVKKRWYNSYIQQKYAHCLNNGVEFWHRYEKSSAILHTIIHHNDCCTIFPDTDQIKMFKYFKWRQHSMEDNLQILKVEYLSHHWLDPTQISNLSVDDQTI